MTNGKTKFIQFRANRDEHYKARIPKRRQNDNHSEVALLMKLEEIMAKVRGELCIDDLTQKERDILNSWASQGFIEAMGVSPSRDDYFKSLRPNTTHILRFSPQAWEYAHRIRRYDSNFFSTDLESMEYKEMQDSGIDGWDTDASYGIVSIYRNQCNNHTVMYGSSVAHDTSITIELHQSAVERDRNLHTNHFSKKKKLVEFSMTESQFGAFLCAMNQGGGIPCTISYREHGKVKVKSWVPETQSLVNEIKHKFEKRIPGALDKILEEATNLANEKTISKTKLRELVNRLAVVKQEIQSNLPYSFNQFVEYIHKTKDIALRELDAKMMWLRDKIGTKNLEEITKPVVLELEAATMDGDNDE